MDIVEELVKIALLGATWVLYLLFALSVVSIGAIAERVLFFARERRQAAAVRGTLVRLCQERDADSERARRIDLALRSGGGSVARALAAGWEFRDGGPEAIAEAVDSTQGVERAALDRGATLLGTIGNNAPFVGLFGTVLGVIEAFSHLAGGDASKMDTVMGGIAEALVATGVGIFVAIPAVVGFNVAQKYAADLEGEVQSLSKLLIATWRRDRAMRPSAEEALAPGVESKEVAKAAEAEAAEGADARTVPLRARVDRGRRDEGALAREGT